MENLFEITIGHGEQLQAFEVKDYVHFEGEQCKFEVFRLGTLVLSLKPDNGHLETCKNPGNLEEWLIHSIADKIESYHL